MTLPVCVPGQAVQISDTTTIQFRPAHREIALYNFSDTDNLEATSTYYANKTLDCGWWFGSVAGMRMLRSRKKTRARSEQCHRVRPDG